MDKDKRKYMKLCKRLNAEQREPYMSEWDWIIQYCYPEEDRILDKLDNPHKYVKKDEDYERVFNYTKIKMSTGSKEDVYMEVPSSEIQYYI